VRKECDRDKSRESAERGENAEQGMQIKMLYYTYKKRGRISPSIQMIIIGECACKRERERENKRKGRMLEQPLNIKGKGNVRIRIRKGEGEREK